MNERFGRVYLADHVNLFISGLRIKYVREALCHDVDTLHHSRSSKVYATKKALYFGNLLSSVRFGALAMSAACCGLQTRFYCVVSDLSRHCTQTRPLTQRPWAWVPRSLNTYHCLYSDWSLKACLAEAPSAAQNCWQVHTMARSFGVTIWSILGSLAPPKFVHDPHYVAHFWFSFKTCVRLSIRFPDNLAVRALVWALVIILTQSIQFLQHVWHAAAVAAYGTESEHYKNINKGGGERCAWLFEITQERSAVVVILDVDSVSISIRVWPNVFRAERISSVTRAWMWLIFNFVSQGGDL